MYRILLTFTILPVLVCTINTSYANSNDSTNTVFTPLYSLNQVKSFIKLYDPKLPIDEYDTAYTKDNLFHINLLAIGPENFLGLDFNYERQVSKLKWIRFFGYARLIIRMDMDLYFQDEFGVGGGTLIGKKRAQIEARLGHTFSFTRLRDSERISQIVESKYPAVSLGLRLYSKNRRSIFRIGYSTNGVYIGEGWSF